MTSASKSKIRIKHEAMRKPILMKLLVITCPLKDVMSVCFRYVSCCNHLCWNVSQHPGSVGAVARSVSLARDSPSARQRLS